MVTGEMHSWFLWGDLRKRDCLEDVGRCRWQNDVKWIFKTWDLSIDWFDLALYMDRWWALVNAVMNLRVP
jgi:hypothetical protein